MRRSCRCFAAAAQHPADRRAQFLVLSMRTAKPTTRPPLSFQQFGSQSLDVLAPRFCFLRPEHPADPLIAGKRGEVLPSRQSLWAGNQDPSQVHRDGMDHSAGDHPGTHRSPIVAPMRTKAALGSARRRALASSATMPAASFLPALAPALRSYALSVWMRGDGEPYDPPRHQLSIYEGRRAGAEHGVHDEEVADHDRGCLGLQPSSLDPQALMLAIQPPPGRP